MVSNNLKIASPLDVFKHTLTGSVDEIPIYSLVEYRNSGPLSDPKLYPNARGGRATRTTNTMGKGLPTFSLDFFLFGDDRHSLFTYKTRMDRNLSSGNNLVLTLAMMGESYIVNASKASQGMMATTEFGTYKYQAQFNVIEINKVKRPPYGAAKYLAIKALSDFGNSKFYKLNNAKDGRGKTVKDKIISIIRRWLMKLAAIIGKFDVFGNVIRILGTLFYSIEAVIRSIASLLFSLESAIQAILGIPDRLEELYDEFKSLFGFGDDDKSEDYNGYNTTDGDSPDAKSGQQTINTVYNLLNAFVLSVFVSLMKQDQVSSTDSDIVLLNNQFDSIGRPDSYSSLVALGGEILRTYESNEYRSVPVKVPSGITASILTYSSFRSLDNLERVRYANIGRKLILARDSNTIKRTKYENLAITQGVDN